MKSEVLKLMKKIRLRNQALKQERYSWSECCQL